MGLYKSASNRSDEEDRLRSTRLDGLLNFGISFLDDALTGILKNDLILLGAPPGVGKTALCCNIALANVSNGKRIHYVALEAAQCEIESRIKYNLVAENFFSDPDRPKIDFNFKNWYIGKNIKELESYQSLANNIFKNSFEKLFTYYKANKFGLDEFEEAVIRASHKTDLIIIDHVHYFDFEDENDNRAIKKIAMLARTLALENEVPIILVSHLRKKDRNNNELVAGLDEFHGTSDLYKIATRVITFAPGDMTSDGCYETFFRIPKDRIDGGNTRFLGRVIFDPRKGKYESKYRVARSYLQKGDEFEAIERTLLPTWARAADSGNILQNSGSKEGLPTNKRNEGVQKSPSGQLYWD